MADTYHADPTIEKVIHNLTEQHKCIDHNLVMPGEDVADLDRTTALIASARMRLRRPVRQPEGAAR